MKLKVNKQHTCTGNCTLFQWNKTNSNEIWRTWTKEKN